MWRVESFLVLIPNKISSYHILLFVHGDVRCNVLRTFHLNYKKKIAVEDDEDIVYL